MPNDDEKTHLYAMIKKSSRRYEQRWHHTDENNKPMPFPVHIPSINPNRCEGEAKGGVGGNYYIKEDLNFYVMVDAEYVRL